MMTSCNEFPGAKDLNGYGKIRRDGKMRMAHRVALADHLGISEEEIAGKVCHSCDNPPCINVQHLFIGSQAQNLADMRSKDRHARGTRNGRTKLSVAQVEEIMARYSLGIETQTDLARAFGVDQSRISRIVRRIEWKVLA